MDKKAMIFTRPRDTISFVIGLILTAFGIIPVLFTLGMISFNLPAFLGLPGNILIWLIAAGGAYVVIDGFVEPPHHALHWFLIIAGLVLLAVGLIPILHTFNVIGFTIPFLDNMVVYHILVTLEGLLLVVGGLTEH